MSQVSFKAIHKGNCIEVMAGWDRPCQEYFLTLFDAEDEPFWSTLEHPEFVQGDKHRLKPVLESMGITPPTGFWEVVERQEGNVSYVHNGQDWIARQV
jgi:hypothetical protein